MHIQPQNETDSNLPSRLEKVFLLDTVHLFLYLIYRHVRRLLNLSMFAIKVNMIYQKIFTIANQSEVPIK